MRGNLDSVRLTRGRDLRQRPRRVSIETLAACLRPGDAVVVGHGGGWPKRSVEALVAGAPGPLHVIHNRIDSPLPYFVHGVSGRVRHRGWMAGHSTRGPMSLGIADYIPNAYGLTPSLIRSGAVPCEVAVLHVSPPDREGWSSLGTCVAYLPEAVERARVVVAQVNPQMPRTHGTAIHHSAIDYTVDVDEALDEGPVAKADPVAEQIATHVARLIDSGATVQLGIGKLADAVSRQLTGKRDLRLRTETFGDAALQLLDDGVLSSATEGEPAIVATFVTGTGDLYRSIDKNRHVQLLPVSMTNSPTRLAPVEQFVAVNSAIEVDLTGQINAESIGAMQYSGTGGHLDFAIAAAYGASGRYICALPSVAAGGGVSRIVPALRSGSVVTVPRSLADTIVTEYGVAHLKGLSTGERAEALIAIAHPDHRAVLRQGLQDDPHRTDIQVKAHA